MSEFGFRPRAATGEDRSGERGSEEVAAAAFAFLVSEGYHGHGPSAAAQAERFAAAVAPAVAALVVAARVAEADRVADLIEAYAEAHGDPADNAYEYVRLVRRGPARATP